MIGTPKGSVGGALASYLRRPTLPAEDPLALGASIVHLDDTEWRQVLDTLLEGARIDHSEDCFSHPPPSSFPPAVVSSSRPPELNSFPALSKPILPKIDVVSECRAMSRDFFLSSAGKLSVPPSSKKGMIPPEDPATHHGKTCPPKRDCSNGCVQEPPIQMQQQHPGIVSFSQAEVRQNAFFFIVSRGGMVLEQPGNRRLRRIVNMFAPEYVETHRPNRGALKHQVFNLCRCQFEFVIQKKAFVRSYNQEKEDSARRQLSHDRVESILQANGGLAAIQACHDTDFIRVGEECALDVVGHLLRDAASEVRRGQRT